MKRDYDFSVQAKCTLQDNQVKELQEKLTIAENKLEVMWCKFGRKIVSLNL